MKVLCLSSNVQLAQFRTLIKWKVKQKETLDPIGFKNARAKNIYRKQGERVYFFSCEMQGEVTRLCNHIKLMARRNMFPVCVICQIPCFIAEPHLS